MTKPERVDLNSASTWQKVFTLIPLQILEIDLEGRILYMNKTLTDKTLEEIIGTRIYDHIPEKDVISIREVYAEVVRTGKAKRFESSMILPDWSQRWFEYYVTPQIRNGKVTKFIVVNQDITEKKTTEKALRESEQKFRALAEQSPNMIFINVMGRVVFANKMCEELMGYTREEYYSPDFNYLSLFAPESLPLIRENFARQMLNEEIPPQEYTLNTKSGKQLSGLVTTRLFSYENEAAILGIVTDITERKKVEDSLKQAHDELEMRVKERTEELTVANELMQIEIEERKRAESALKLEEEKLRTFLDSSPDAITVTDLSGNIVDCNPATVKQYRYGGKQELINKNALDMIAEQDRARAMRNMEATIREGSVSNVEYLMLRKDGTIYPAELSASVVKDGRGEISRFVAVTKDISERKASEDALLRSQAELREQKKALEQKNIALGEIIAQIEIEKKKIQDDITLNVRRVLIPILDKMVQASDPKPLLAMFRRHLDGLTSTYGSRISEKAANLTPREVEICNMIKGGLSSRDIAELLNISQATVERHRKNIRGKLKLTNQDVNLAVFLRGL